MRIHSTEIKEVKIIDTEAGYDNRGYSYSIYNREDYKKAGLYFDYTEERVYMSEKAGTLYGIHFQNNPSAQSKLIYCVEGSGLDYAVDLRKESPTYQKWICVELSAKNNRQIYIPKGFGHVWLTLEDRTRNVMRFDVPFDPKYSRQIAYNDPTIGILYPTDNFILAPHDIEAPFLKDSDCNL